MGGDSSHKSEHLLIILPFEEPTATLDRMRKDHPYLKITFKSTLHNDTIWQHNHELKDDIYADATMLVTLSVLPSDPALAPHLRLIHFISAGTNHIASSPIYKSTKIPLTTSSGIHGPQISEWVLMTALVSSHSYHKLHEWQQQHKWANGGQEPALKSLRDKTGQRLGILGYGSIGRQVARVMGSGCGMEVYAYTASSKDTPESKKDHGYIVPGTGDKDGSIPKAWFSGLDKPSLHRFLSQDLDMLLISVPLTKETTGFIGAEELAILGKQRNAFISNISRGQIIDQSALIESLKRYADDDPILVDGGKGGGGIRGAALDVADPEPLPKDNPLWTAPNCIVTPHISGHGSTYVERALEVFDINLGKEERGEKLINVVDRERGY